jgi:hypothetical protein
MMQQVADRLDEFSGYFGTVLKCVRLYCSGAGIPLSIPFCSFGVLCCVYVPFWDPCVGAANLSQ